MRIFPLRFLNAKSPSKLMNLSSIILLSVGIRDRLLSVVALDYGNSDQRENDSLLRNESLSFEIDSESRAVS